MRLQPCANALRVETVPAFRQLPVAVAAASADVVKAYGAVHRLQSGVGWLAADSGVEFLQQGQRVDELKLIIHFMVKFNLFPVFFFGFVLVGYVHALQSWQYI